MQRKRPRRKKTRKPRLPAATRLIIAQKRDLEKRIAGDTELKADFDRILARTGWSRTMLLQLVYWDAGRYRRDFKEVRARAFRGKRWEEWREDAYSWRSLPKRVLKVVKDIERANRSAFFSPLHIADYSRFLLISGPPLAPAEQRRVRSVFSGLPDILSAWTRVVQWKVDWMAKQYPQHRANIHQIFTTSDASSLEAKLYLATGRVFSGELYRLFDASLQLLENKIVSKRAFDIRLNRLTKRLPGKQRPK
jgi:hypothetical protein